MANVFTGPPMKQSAETGLALFLAPIKLGSEVIQPAFAQPFPRIGKESVVGIQTFDLRRMAWSPDSEGGDAELDPRFRGANGLADAHDEQINIFAAPILPVQPPAAILVTLPAPPIGKNQRASFCIAFRM